MAILAPFPITGDDRIVFGGDSITAPTRAWQADLIRRLNAIYLPAQVTGVSAAPGALHGSFGPPSSRAPVYFNTAIGGQILNDLITNFDAQFTVWNPTKAIVLVGVNDITINGTTLGTFTTQEATFAGLFASRLPACKVLRISIQTAGEVWTSGTPNTWGPNAGGFDSTIDSFNAAIRAQCVTSGFGYIDGRGWWLNLAPTLNPSHLASGVFTVNTDGVHPSDGTAGPFGIGKLALCDAVQAGLSVLP